MQKKNRIKKPIYKRPAFYIPVAVVAFAITGAVDGGGGSAQEPTQTLTTETTNSTTSSEIETRSPEATGSERTETDFGLSPTTAQVACVNYGDQMAYPDKLKIHTIVGKKQEQVNDDEIRFLWDATLTTSAGGELKGEVLCVVTGSDDLLTVETFEFL